MEEIDRLTGWVHHARRVFASATPDESQTFKQNLQCLRSLSEFVTDSLDRLEVEAGDVSLRAQSPPLPSSLDSPHAQIRVFDAALDKFGKAQNRLDGHIDTGVAVQIIVSCLEISWSAQSVLEAMGNSSSIPVTEATNTSAPSGHGSAAHSIFEDSLTATPADPMNDSFEEAVSRIHEIREESDGRDPEGDVGDLASSSKGQSGKGGRHARGGLRFDTELYNRLEKFHRLQRTRERIMERLTAAADPSETEVQVINKLIDAILNLDRALSDASRGIEDQDSDETAELDAELSNIILESESFAQALETLQSLYGVSGCA